MADPVVVLLILIAGSSPEREQTQVVASGISDALGSDARILFEEREVAPSDEEARRLGAGITVSAVAELKWLDRKRSRVNVHVYITADDAFADRELSFGPNDAPEERERAVGLLVGSMVRNAYAAHVDTDVDAPDLDASEMPAPAPRTIETPPKPSDADRAVPRVPSRDASTTRRMTIAIDASATGAAPIGGQGSGIGPSIGGEAFVAERFGVRVSGAARFGTVAQADATTSTLRLGAGPVIRVLGANASSRVDVQIAVEALALNQAVTRANVRQDRWQAGAYATVRVGYRIFAGVEPFVGVGGETAFGATPINVDGRTAAVLPELRVTADLGARLYF